MKFLKEPHHEKLTDFYKKNGLEIENGWSRTGGAFFSLYAEENGQIAGAATFAKRFGVTLLDYIAVDPALRKNGLGKMLFFTALKEAPAVKSIYLIAKAPGFFKAIGCQYDDSMPRLLAECIQCPQYKKECAPAVMRYVLEETI